MNRKDPLAAAVLVDAGGSEIKIRLPGRRAVHRPRPALLTPTVLGSLVRRALQRRRAEYLVAGLRGVWTAKEKQPWRKALARLARRAEVLSDIELAHRLAFPEGVGIIVNAGTGSIAYGRDARGRAARAGGKGPLLGDEGSGFWIGREWLRRAAKNQAFRRYLRDPRPVRAIAALARRVLSRAHQNPRSIEGAIAREAVGHLVALARQVKHDLRWRGPAPFALAGGLFQNPGFRAAFERAARQRGFSKRSLRPRRGA